jgi:hypothetical protein
VFLDMPGVQMGRYCGIDWADDHHDIAIIDDTGTVLVKERVGNDADGFARQLELLAEAGDSPEDPISVAIETDRGLWVAALRATGRVVYAINPLSASRYRSQRTVSGAKSDAADAVMLANILRLDYSSHRPIPNDTDLARAIKVRQRNVDADAARLREILRHEQLRQPAAVERAMGIHYRHSCNVSIAPAPPSKRSPRQQLSTSNVIPTRRSSPASPASLMSVAPGYSPRSATTAHDSQTRGV